VSSDEPTPFAILDRTWAARAACRGSSLPWIASAGVSRKKVAAMRAVCSGCLVAAECLDYAKASRSLGLWAGTTARERGNWRG
jgi:hypothetical protein